MSTQSQSNETPHATVIGRIGCPLAYMIRDFLSRSGVPFDWIDLKTDEQAREYGGTEGLGDSRLPAVVFADGQRVDHPTIRQIVEKLGWFRDPSRTEYDLAIYGAGPAGLSAAVYGASEGLSTVLIERYTVGGQAGSSSRIENYLGFPDGISGADLAERAREQACKFGAEILLAREGVSAQLLPGKGVGTLADGTKIVTRATICATGVGYRRLGLADEDRFLNAGLYYGAGASEASLCTDEHVFVIGGGNSAGQGALHFARYARRVTLVIRGECLRTTLSQYLADRIYGTPNIEVRNYTEVSALTGDEVLREIELTHRQTGTKEKFPTRWLFVCIGGDPHTDWAADIGVVRDEGGYLVTGPDLQPEGRKLEGWPINRHPYYLETNKPGLFAVGDVRHGSIKRCASAVGEGAMAVAFVHRYLADG